ncbi:MAG: PTS sugar transporter subunit IIA [Rhizobiales bacterium 62-17]|nr:PTS sugar transporter subunit IIA [Hyphomicrobiales bacterium]OJY03392.1 MAG: PTS sugar transporter subunit IIA [Rhizobiales bacterium 62-17]
MNISDLLSEDSVLIDVRSSNKRSLLQDLAANAAARVGLKSEDVAHNLLKREELGSTGLGGGIAVPHARLDALERPYGVLAKLKQPIEFDAIDGQAVDIVFVLLLPSNVENKQLGPLALVARTLRSADTVGKMRKSKTQAELFAAVTVSDPV